MTWEYLRFCNHLWALLLNHFGKNIWKNHVTNVLHTQVAELGIMGYIWIDGPLIKINLGVRCLWVARPMATLRLQAHVSNQIFKFHGECSQVLWSLYTASHVRFQNFGIRHILTVENECLASGGLYYWNTFPLSRVSFSVQEPKGGVFQEQASGTNFLRLNPSLLRSSLDTLNESGFHLINEGKMEYGSLFFLLPSPNMSDDSSKSISSVVLWCCRCSCWGVGGWGLWWWWVMAPCLFPYDPSLIVFWWEMYGSLGSSASPIKSLRFIPSIPRGTLLIHPSASSDSSATLAILRSQIWRR